MELAYDILWLVVVLLEHKGLVEHKLRSAGSAALLFCVAKEVKLLPWLIRILDVEEDKVQ